MAAVDSAARHAVRKTRACIPCHERKVKCNVEATGVPCTRCAQHDRVALCQLVPRPERMKERRRRIRRDSIDRRRRADAPEPIIFAPPNPSVGRGTEDTAATTFAGLVSSEPLADCTSQARDGNGVAEEDSQLETCLQIAQDGSSKRYELTSAASTPGAQEVYAYHAGNDSTAIMGQVLNPEKARKFVRVVVRQPRGAGQESEVGLDGPSMAYLRSVGAWNVPQYSVCQKLVHLYFARVDPYVPVLHRRSLMKKLSQGTCSTFLLQCIFTTVTPYMSAELLADSGHASRAQAQLAFFSKARALYDMGAEESQLHRLQGSLMLTASYFSFGLDQDCRFWLHNAVRIAMQMGLHQRQMAEQLHRDEARLLRRIFWVLYSRDIVMVMAGRINVRALNDWYCDVPELTEDDWEEEAEREVAAYGLSPISRLHKLYLVHCSRLDRICAQYIEAFKRPGFAPTVSICEEIDQKITTWKRSLPRQLQLETVDSWSDENVWILVLRALGCRFQSLFCRDIRLLAKAEEQECRRRALAKQQNSMLELDAMIRCILLNHLTRFCPFSMTTCASTLIAMHFECAVGCSSTDAQRQIHRESIQNGVAYLRSSADLWDSVGWSLRMFEAIGARLRLPVDAPVLCGPEPTAEREGSRQGGGEQANEASHVWAMPDPANYALARSAQDHKAAWAAAARASTTSSSMEPDFLFESLPLDAGLEGALDEISFEDWFGLDSASKWM